MPDPLLGGVDDPDRAVVVAAARGEQRLERAGLRPCVAASRRGERPDLDDRAHVGRVARRRLGRGEDMPASLGPGSRQARYLADSSG